MTDRRYHFPGGAETGFPLWLPTPEAAPRVCAATGAEAAVRSEKKDQKAAKNGRIATCQTAGACYNRRKTKDEGFVWS